MKYPCENLLETEAQFFYMIDKLITMAQNTNTPEKKGPNEQTPEQCEKAREEQLKTANTSNIPKGADEEDEEDLKSLKGEVGKKKDEERR